ncbi:MAG: hypothetical protein KF810_18450 [Rhizobiaceae bacterium]|nr:hypothetical protein [Rhizobiaceae bacterium]
MELLEAIEHFGPARLLRSSFFVYPVVSAIHVAALGALLTSVMLMGLATLGVIRSIATEKLVGLLRPVAFLAFALAASTGLMLFSVQATTYAQNAAFILKIGLIVLAAINFLVFVESARRNPAVYPSPAMRAGAALSILLWGGVLLAGRFIGYL